MALDARSRSSIYQKLIPVLGEDDANTLMSEFPAIEADELVTKQFLRAELAEFRGEFRSELAALRTELHQAMHRQTHWTVGAVSAAMSILGALGVVG